MWNLLVQLLVDFLPFVPGENSKHPVLENNRNAVRGVQESPGHGARAPHLRRPAVPKVLSRPTGQVLV